MGIRLQKICEKRCLNRLEQMKGPLQTKMCSEPFLFLLCY